VKAGDKSFSFGIKGADCWKLLGVFFETKPVKKILGHQYRREMTNNFIDQEKVYLPVEADGDKAFCEWSKNIGRPAVLPVREIMLEPERIIPLKTAWVIYIERELICPEDRDIKICFGQNVPMTVWLNGEELLFDEGESEWQPETSWIDAKLKAGKNRLRIRLDRMGADVDFSCQIRDSIQLMEGHNWVGCYDYNVDLAETNPFNLLKA
ncbi:MAG: hypothetical protein JXR97_15900, partial [Planctomycetes bacterium]|nr:hypothetical protein [Planctomycetota bacterium]